MSATPAPLSALERIKLSRQPSPLSLFLTIYCKANRECYMEYMRGAKALLAWLGEIDYPTDRYPEILNPNFRVPNLLRSYPLNELAKMLEPYEKYNNMDEYYRANVIAQNAIYFVMSREVIIELY